MTLAANRHFLPRLRFLSSIVALLGLLLLATASTSSTRGNCSSSPFEEQGNARSSFVDASADLSVTTGGNGALEDWDDESKPTLPRCELPYSTPRTVARAAATHFPPRCFTRVTDRRTATLVGTVLLLI